MERPDDILFSGAKVGKDTPPSERRRTPRARRAKPSRPAPPAQTDGQRREEGRSGTRNPFQERNNIAGTGDTRTARGQRRRDAMARRRTSRDAAAARQAAEAAPAAPRGRALREKPRRPRRNS